MHWGDGVEWFWPMGIGMVLWVVLLIVLIGGAVWLLSRARYGAPGPGPDSAEEVLRRRFAAGEIDEEEYRRRLTALRH